VTRPGVNEPGSLRDPTVADRDQALAHALDALRGADEWILYTWRDGDGGGHLRSAATGMTLMRFASMLAVALGEFMEGEDED
jgi:hypothetical protein